MTLVQPKFQSLYDIIVDHRSSLPKDDAYNLYPIYSFVNNDSITPHLAYLKLCNDSSSPKTPSFLFESAKNGDTVDRYSFIGFNPRKIIKTGVPGKPETDIDPLILLEKELNKFKQAQLPGLNMPSLNGGAVGYISYDCIKYFEPKTKRDFLADNLKLPESIIMLFDIVVAFDNLFQRFQIINNIQINSEDDKNTINLKYLQASKEIQKIEKKLSDTSKLIPYPYQPQVILNQPFVSNIGQEGYENHVKILKDHILKGDIIQAVPSQRISRPTSLHPFNIYRHLRTVNPSPYLFYIDYVDFQIVGASPELLVKSNSKNKVVTHPIAGTIKRGTTKEEDDDLANILKTSLKDRAEHIMLVDLARNDINRICDPLTTNVDRLLTIERFSHVMHLVSEVSGTLRQDKTRFDAFRSIFPAGTVSGAPKIKAMELISELEREKRGVYAGAVGNWGYDGKTMNTCIALRTMVIKNGVAYLQAGGGIVFDSDPYDEYIETMNKMKANNNTIVEAEEIWIERLKDENYNSDS
ncbi:anthranilate synthase TRP2 [Ascoidea rubescens DSM 1968]|uniref:anthranilate synthase n=1 Tax=Ascoidea rubescens DSM 1968 TaxID=1344418 RepID=A0A1D2VSI1_9ASCO|nr:anthranilate synthase [Ascoidea rubescens DSM 1968]ODV64538.1 anthranilate synthase [Ascoidea rubescens DSM 1968]